jgi:hypothetical protein
MTISEASARARAIWGDYRLLSVRLREDGSADVNLLRSGPASDVSGASYSAHRLNAHGHAVCHDECVLLEPKL